MAHKKGGGSTRNGRDSKAKRLGVKVFVNVVRSSTLVTMSAWARTTRSTLSLTAL